REAQHLLDHFRQAAAFIPNDFAVSFQPFRLLNYTVGEVFSGGTNHRERCSKLMADRRNEFYLLPCKPLCARCRHDDNSDTCSKHSENAEADQKIAPSQLSHSRV